MILYSILPCWREIKSRSMLRLPSAVGLTYSVRANHGTPPRVHHGTVCCPSVHTQGTRILGKTPLGLEPILSRNHLKPFSQKFSPLPKAGQGLTSHEPPSTSQPRDPQLRGRIDTQLGHQQCRGTHACAHTQRNLQKN